MFLSHKLARLVFVLGALCLAAAALAGDIRDDILQAIQIDDVSQVAAQLARGADPNLMDEEGNTLLMRAVRDNAPASVDLLLAAGARVTVANAYGDTPLHLAAWGGNERIVRALLDRGASVMANTQGWTPLMYAAYGGHARVVELLLQAGSPVNAVNWAGLSALMLAAMKGHEDVVLLLLAAGADADLVAADGKTARDLALEHGNTDIAEQLGGSDVPQPR